MKLIKTANGSKTIKINKKEWQSIGKTAGWMKKAQIMDDEIMKILQNTDRPGKIKQLMDYYVKIHPNASGYELNTLWSVLGPESLESINQYIQEHVINWVDQPMNQN